MPQYRYGIGKYPRPVTNEVAYRDWLNRAGAKGFRLISVTEETMYLLCTFVQEMPDTWQDEYNREV